MSFLQNTSPLCTTALLQMSAVLQVWAGCVGTLLTQSQPQALPLPSITSHAQYQRPLLQLNGMLGKVRGFVGGQTSRAQRRKAPQVPPQPPPAAGSAGLNRWDSASVLGDETRGLFFPPTPSRAVRRKTTASSYEGVVVCSQ